MGSGKKLYKIFYFLQNKIKEAFNLSLQKMCPLYWEQNFKLCHIDKYKRFIVHHKQNCLAVLLLSWFKIYGLQKCNALHLMNHEQIKCLSLRSNSLEVDYTSQSKIQSANSFMLIANLESILEGRNFSLNLVVALWLRENLIVLKLCIMLCIISIFMVYDTIQKIDIIICLTFKKFKMYVARVRF